MILLYILEFIEIRKAMYFNKILCH